jgi:hypothetical protein
MTPSTTAGAGGELSRVQMPSVRPSRPIARCIVLLMLLPALLGVTGCDQGSAPANSKYMTPYMDRPATAMSEDEYVSAAQATLAELENGVGRLRDSTSAAETLSAARAFAIPYQRMAGVVPPPRFAQGHETLMKSLGKCKQGSDGFIAAVGTSDKPSQKASLELMLLGYMEVKTLLTQRR